MKNIFMGILAEIRRFGEEREGDLTKDVSLKSAEIPLKISV